MSSQTYSTYHKALGPWVTGKQKNVSFCFKQKESSGKIKRNLLLHLSAGTMWHGLTQSEPPRGWHCTQICQWWCQAGDRGWGIFGEDVPYPAGVAEEVPTWISGFQTPEQKGQPNTVSNTEFVSSSTIIHTLIDPNVSQDLSPSGGRWPGDPRGPFRPTQSHVLACHHICSLPPHAHHFCATAREMPTSSLRDIQLPFCHTSTCIFMPNSQPFPTLCGSCVTEMETAILRCSSPVKQASCMPPRARWTACWLFHSLSLFYSSLAMIFMSKAATAIHGNCIQHPSQICIFPSGVMVSRMSKHTCSARESLPKAVVISSACFKSLIITTTSPSPSCSLTASPPFPNAITSHIDTNTFTAVVLTHSVLYRNIVNSFLFICLFCTVNESKLLPTSKSLGMFFWLISLNFPQPEKNVFIH